jgi:hypothetical protein
MSREWSWDNQMGFSQSKRDEHRRVFNELSLWDNKASRPIGGGLVKMNDIDRDKWHHKVLADRDAYWAKQRKSVEK